MNPSEIAEMIQAIKESNFPQKWIDEIIFDVDFKHTVVSLESRLRGGYQFQEIIMDTLGTTMEYYDADSALVIDIDMDMMIAKPEFEIHREGFPPVCGTEPMYLNDYPAILKHVQYFALMGKAFPYTEVLPLLEGDETACRRIEQLGIHSLMAVPYHKRNTGFVAVINPRKYLDDNSLLQVLSYVSVAEINEMNLMNASKKCIFDDRDLADNQVYVKLLNGFELHTREGVVTEKDFKRKKGVAFLTLLLWQDGRSSAADALIEQLWGDSVITNDRERSLKNLEYDVKKDLTHLFPDKPFLEIKRAGCSISRRYNIVTDLDRFSYRIRDVEGIKDPEKRLGEYLKALDGFSGMVLPSQERSVIAHVTERYESSRKSVQNTCLALMFDLGKYEKMREFISTISLARKWDRELAYWDIKSYIGMERVEQARKLLEENRELLSDTQISELESVFSAVL